MAGGITFGTCKRKRAAWVRRATSNARSARQVGFPSRQYSAVRGRTRASADHRLHREVRGFGGRPQQVQQAGHQQQCAGADERRAVFVAGMGGLLRFLHACRRGVRHSNGYCNGSREARPRYDGFYGTGMLSGARVVRAEREVYQPRGVKKGTVERSCRLPASRRPASYQFNGPDTVKNCRERARPARRPRSRLHRHVAWFVPAAVRRNFRPGRRTFLSRRTPCDIHCSTPTRPPWRGVHPNPTLASPCRGVPRGGVSHE